MDLALEHCRFARELFRMIVAREHDLYVALITRLFSFKLLLESRDELSRSELELVVLGCSAAECLAVHKALEVEHESVALFGGSVLDVLHPCLALLYLFELSLDFLVADLRLDLFDLEAFVFLYIDLREYLYASCKNDRLVLLDLRSIE